MRKLTCFASVIAAGLLSITSVPSAVAQEQKAAGFAPLFNGKDFAGWYGVPHYDPRKLAAMSDVDRKKQIDSWMKDTLAHWTVENGEIVNDGKGPYLTTEKEFADFELKLDYKTVAQADSGIYLRWNPQVQIWDWTKEGGKWNRGADKGSGGLFNNAKRAPGQEPLVLADKPFGEWNAFRIVQVGARTSVWLNEKLVVDRAVMENFWDRSKPHVVKGPFQLQTHGGEIRWRNLMIREIGAAEANQWLSAASSSGIGILPVGISNPVRNDSDRLEAYPTNFTPLFNGKDLSNWQGDVASYDVVDGTIVNQQGKGGNLFTKDEYQDFVVRLEFKLPPAGNNGLAIRYSGKGQPHVAGMCEVQILDSEHEKYAKLDARQYHGSVYGMIPAQRGFLRPTGEWNFQEVTVQGSKVKVELNGFVILDGDVSKVTDFKDDPKAYVGKDRTSGFFGFAGHGDPVAFRNVSIKRLEAGAETKNSSWPQFRGRNASGLAATAHALPTKIGPDTNNIVWKTELPPGHSSPVVFGDRVFVTGIRDGKKLVTIGLDRATGKVLWEKEAPYEKLEKIHGIGSHAQSSPVTDGEIVVSFFGSSGLHAYDKDGNALWSKRMGPFNNDFGAGSSPIIEGDRVILVQDHDTDSFLAAFDKRTGSQIWKTDRSEFPRNYCSPTIWEVNGKKQIVVAATLRVVGYDYDSGNELWTVRGISRAVQMTPMVGADGRLYVAGWAAGGDVGEPIVLPDWKDAIGFDSNKNNVLEETETKGNLGPVHQRFSQIDRDKTGTITEQEYSYFQTLFKTGKNSVIAITPGGSGDITSTHVAWEHRKFLPFCSTPLYVEGYLFTIKDGGICTSLDATKGTILKTGRLPGNGEYYASPVGGDNKVYAIDDTGKLSVLSSYAEWTVLAEADFKDEAHATPALVDGKIYLRTKGALYCFGEK